MEMVMMMTPFSKNQTIACLLNYKIFPHSTSNIHNVLRRPNPSVVLGIPPPPIIINTTLVDFDPQTRDKRILCAVSKLVTVSCVHRTLLCVQPTAVGTLLRIAEPPFPQTRDCELTFIRSRVKFTKLQKKFRNVHKQAECDEDCAQIKHQLVSLGGICGLKKGTLL